MTRRNTSPAAEYVSVDQLKPWAKNPRKNDPSVQGIMDSIKRFGFGAPLLARKANGEVIAGHTRLKAAIRLGMSEVPVRYLDLSETEAHALALADNKLTEITEWNNAALSDVFQELFDAGADVNALGWLPDEINVLLDEIDPTPLGEEEVRPLDQKKPKICACPHCGATFDVNAQG